TAFADFFVADGVHDRLQTSWEYRPIAGGHRKQVRAFIVLFGRRRGVRRFSFIIAGSLLVAASNAAPPAKPTTLPSSTQRATTQLSPTWELITGDGYAIGAPAGMQPVANLPPGAVMLRQIQSVSLPGWVNIDAPIQIILGIESFPQVRQTPEEGAASLSRAARSNVRAEFIGTDRSEAVKLSDGSSAQLLTIEFIERHRRTIQMKLFARGADGGGWVVTAFVVGHETNPLMTKDSMIVAWVANCMQSLCFNRARFDGELLDSSARQFLARCQRLAEATTAPSTTQPAPTGG
ncbi:MAG: hypothetical protein ACREJC_05215, partial [Tepidisphaeraceae bacterium]